MSNRLVSEVIQGRQFPITGTGTTVREAAIIMKEWHSSAILIVHKGLLTGICTERDIVFRAVATGCDPANTVVSTIMTRNLRTIGPDKPFGDALQLMVEGGFRHIPVVDAAGHPVGLLAAHDALEMDGIQLEQYLVRRKEVTVTL